MSIVWGVVYFALLISVLLLIVRFIFDFVSSVSRQFRPRGLALFLAEVSYTVTDPPIRGLRRFIKPVRIGQIMLDLVPGLLMFVLLIALQLVPV